MDGIKSKERRLGWGGGTQCMCRYHEGVLSQYVHIGYSTQALYCCIHVASADITL